MRAFSLSFPPLYHLPRCVVAAAVGRERDRQINIVGQRGKRQGNVSVKKSKTKSETTTLGIRRREDKNTEAPSSPRSHSLFTTGRRGSVARSTRR